MKLITLFVFAILLSPIAGHINTTSCNSCMDNGIACVSETQYYKCQNGKISTEVLYDCPENKVCSHTLDMCIVRSTHKPACPLSQMSFCGICAKINVHNEVTSDRKTSFACVGPNHYKTCRDHMISNDITFICKPGTICSINSFEKTGQICVPKSVMNAHNDSASCLETPKLLPKELARACLKFLMRPNILCYNMLNPYDTECRSYLHCNRKDGQLEGRIIKCEQGFYNFHQNKCVKERPSMCGQASGVAVPVKTTTTTKLPSTSATTPIDVPTTDSPKSTVVEAQNDVSK